MRLFAVGGLPKVYRFCLCFVEVDRVERGGNGQARLPADVYEIHPNMARVHPGILTVITQTVVASSQAEVRSH